MFSDVAGQANLKKSLIYAVNENRIPHAILLSGPEGTGKLALAIALAQYLNCEDKGEHDSCGRCISCLKFKKLIHPDLHFVFPIMKKDGKTNTVCDDYIFEWREMVLADPYFSALQWYTYIGKEKGQGTIYADEANEIIRKLNLKTFEAEYKCMIIWLPEKLHSTAANKILKILEEPPDKTVFILVTEAANEILPTLVSRCQLVKVPPLDDASLFAALSEKHELPEHEIRNAVLMSEGNLIKASSMLESTGDVEIYLEHFMSLMRLTYGKKIMELIAWAESVSRLSQDKQKEFLSYVLKSLRENFMITAGAGHRVIQAPEEKAFSDKFHPYINERNIFQMVEEMEKASYHIERNGKAKIIFLDLALTIMQLIR
jgi:DNA polymerase-3 subunit delta'